MLQFLFLFLASSLHCRLVIAKAFYSCVAQNSILFLIICIVFIIMSDVFSCLLGVRIREDNTERSQMLVGWFHTLKTYKDRERIQKVLLKNNNISTASFPIFQNLLQIN